jgi:hypothetical protein
MNIRTAVVYAGVALVLLTGCGGGGGGTSFSTPTPTTPPPAPLSLNPLLPAAVVGRPYSATAKATNGTPPYKWSATGVPGWLTFDANTGTFSGTPSSTADSQYFTLQVTDSSSPAQTVTATNALVPVSAPLSLDAADVSVAQYAAAYGHIFAVGGVEPYTYSITAGALPRGVTLQPYTSFAILRGTPLVTGTYPVTVTVQDSLSPPDVATRAITITVTRPSLYIASSLPWTIALNRPFSGRAVAAGGLPPYTFALLSGSALPTGLTLDPSSGVVAGTPTEEGQFQGWIQVTDSQSRDSRALFDMKVAPPLARNDSPATATPITNGFYNGSISPYMDPPSTATPGDSDYYAIQVMPGSTLQVSVTASQFGPGKTPLDTVLELVDGNGVRLTTCRQPGDASSSFNSQCINDDISASPHNQNSALDYQAGGSATSPQTVYAHVLDWRGDARPDMTYTLSVSGAFVPLEFDPRPLLPGAAGLFYYDTMLVTGGIQPIKFTVVSGQLPPGLSLTSASYIAIVNGTPTTPGTYDFTIQAGDNATPQQTVTHDFRIVVNTPLVLSFTPPANLQAGKTYQVQAQASGGVAPYNWSLSYVGWPPPASVDPATGLVTITPAAAGTINFTLWVSDTGPPQQSKSQSFSLTVSP